jgi:hypothetical protein
MKTRTIVAVTGLFCCLALSMKLFAQSDADTVEKIKQLQQEAINAEKTNDAAWAQQHLADGFTEGTSWGEWMSRADSIKDMQNKGSKFNSGNLSDVQVATFGPNVAVAHYTFTYDASFNGTHRARSVICSDTWVNDSGTWKSAATHCSVAHGK